MRVKPNSYTTRRGRGKVYVAMSPHKFLRNSTGQAGGVDKKNTRVFVATYTKEGLSFQIQLGPLKFEPSKRGRRSQVPVAVI